MCPATCACPCHRTHLGECVRCGMLNVAANLTQKARAAWVEMSEQLGDSHLRADISRLDYSRALYDAALNLEHAIASELLVVAEKAVA